MVILLVVLGRRIASQVSELAGKQKLAAKVTSGLKDLLGTSVNPCTASFP